MNVITKRNDIKGIAKDGGNVNLVKSNRRSWNH